MIDPATLRTFDDVKQHTLKALQELHASLAPGSDVTAFASKAHAAAHLLPLTRGDVGTIDAAVAEHDPYEIDDPIVRLSDWEGEDAPVGPAVASPADPDPSLGGDPGAGPADADAASADAAEAAEDEALVARLRAPRGAPRGKSYQALIRELMVELGGRATRDELMGRVGLDAQGLSTAVSILGNPVRTREHMRLRYDRATQTYSVVESLAAGGTSDAK